MNFREEFHRRLKVYHAWKAKNKKKGGGGGGDAFGMGPMGGMGGMAGPSSSTLPDMSFEEGMRAPNSVLEEAASTPVTMERKSVASNQDQARMEREAYDYLQL